MGHRQRQRKRRPDRTSEPAEPLDLREIFEEQAVPSTPEAWFEARWNIGRNAIHLGIDLITEISVSVTAKEALAQIRQLLEEHKEALYWPAQDLKDDFRAYEESDLLIGPLDMIQKLSARSDGGGEVYNQILLRMCHSFMTRGGNPDQIEPIVRRWRARDFVQLEPEDVEPGDPQTQKKIRTFERLWQKRLFRFAFCVS